MKIAAIVPSLRRTAPIFVAADLCQGFAERGHDVTLFHLDDVVQVAAPVRSQRLSCTGIARLAGFDVVHSHMLRPDLLNALASGLVRSKTVFVSTIHNYVRADVANTHGHVVAAVTAAIWTRAWRRMDACVVLSEDAKAYYHASLARQELVCIPNGRAPHRPAAAPVAEDALLKELRSRYRIIGSNALVTPRKGLEQVVRALAGLPGYAFVLAGSGPALDALNELARATGVSERFVTLGFKDNVRDYLDYYDLYAMPSRSEGLGLAMLEAAAAGLPIVCSELPVFREVFDDEQAAFFELDDQAGLQRAVRRAYDDRGRLGTAALRRFEQAYSLDAMVGNYLSLFNRLQAAAG